MGPGSLFGGLAKQVLETALEVEISDHLGYEANDPIGRNGGDSRNGVRSKTVTTEVGPVEIDVPRDRAGTFEPQIVRKRQRRLAGVDDLVLSLTAKGLTSGETSAHFAEIYGTSVSKETISRITDQVIEAMVEWQNRPLDRVYPVVFIDALFVKIRDGQVANRRSTSRSVSPLTANATSSGCGSARPVARVRSSGSPCSPRSRIGASKTSASSSD